MQIIQIISIALIPALCFLCSVVNSLRLYRRMESILPAGEAGKMRSTIRTSDAGRMSLNSIQQRPETLAEVASTSGDLRSSLRQTGTSKSGGAPAGGNPKKTLQRSGARRFAGYDSVSGASASLPAGAITKSAVTVEKTLDRSQAGIFGFLGGGYDRVVSEPEIPKSLKALKRPEPEFDGSGNFHEDDFSLSSPGSVSYDPKYLNLKAEVAQKTPEELQQDLSEAEKAVSKMGQVLHGLGADAKLRKEINPSTVLDQFRKNWLEKVPPEHREDPALLEEIAQVEAKVSRLLKLSTEKYKLEKPILDERESWTRSLTVQRKGLKQAVLAHIKIQSDDILKNEISKIFLAQNQIKTQSADISRPGSSKQLFNENWKPEAVRASFKPMVDKFLQQFDYKQLDYMYDSIGFVKTTKQESGRKVPELIVDQQKKKFKNKLLDKLAKPPQVLVKDDPEWNFIFEKVSERLSEIFSWLSHEDLVELNQERIAKIIQEKVGLKNLEILMELKFQFHVFEPPNQAAQKLLKAQLSSTALKVANNEALMKKVYNEQLKRLIHQSGEMVEAQLFQKNFGIELSSREIYEKMKWLGDTWKVDMKAFQKQFQDGLPYADYADLHQATSHSKSYYSDVLDKIKDKRGVNSFKAVEAQSQNEEHFSTSVQTLLQTLKSKGTLGAREYTDLHALASNSYSDSLKAMQQLRKKLNIDLFDRLETESVPQLQLSVMESSIMDFLDKLSGKSDTSYLKELKEKGLLTSEESSKVQGLLSNEERDYLSLRVTRERDPIEEFSRKVNELEGFPAEFKKRLENSPFLARAFDKIKRDDNFISQTVKNQFDDLSSIKNVELKAFPKDSKSFKEIHQKLQPEAIQKEASERLTDDAWAQNLWDDYFKREYNSYLTSYLEEKKMHYKKPFKENLEVYSSKILDVLENADDHSQELSYAISTKLFEFGQTKTSGLKNPDEVRVVSDELNKIIDRRNLILLKQPLTEGDKRLENTPFRLLKKDTINGWNASVRRIGPQLEQISENIMRRNLKGTLIKKTLEPLQPYYGIIADSLRRIDRQFSPIQPMTKIYEYKPESAGPNWGP